MRFLVVLLLFVLSIPCPAASLLSGPTLPLEWVAAGNGWQYSAHHQIYYKKDATGEWYANGKASWPYAHGLQPGIPQTIIFQYPPPRSFSGGGSVCRT